MAVEKRKKRKQSRILQTGEQRAVGERALADILKHNPNSFNLPATKLQIDDLSDYFVQSSEGSMRILPK